MVAKSNGKKKAVDPVLQEKREAYAEKLREFRAAYEIPESQRRKGDPRTYTQKSLATALRMKRETYAAYEQARALPDTDVLDELSRLTGIPRPWWDDIHNHKIPAKNSATVSTNSGESPPVPARILVRLRGEAPGDSMPQTEEMVEISGAIANINGKIEAVRVVDESMDPVLNLGMLVGVKLMGPGSDPREGVINCFEDGPKRIFRYARRGDHGDWMLYTPNNNKPPEPIGTWQPIGVAVHKELTSEYGLR